MDLVSKISRLNKIPEMLKHKQEQEDEEKKQKREEEQRRQRRKENWDKAATFEFGEHAPSVSTKTIDEFKVKSRKAEPPKPQKPSGHKKEGVGERIDLTI